jgi:hypothetical protein
MSRTYRRIRGDMHHRGGYTEFREYGHYFDEESGYYRSWSIQGRAPDTLTREMILNRVKFHMDGRRTMGQTPTWWWHMTTTVPARREERDLCKKILRLKDLEDAPIFPDRKRPKEWYW